MIADARPLGTSENQDGGVYLMLSFLAHYLLSLSLSLSLSLVDLLTQFVGAKMTELKNCLPKKKRT